MNTTGTAPTRRAQRRVQTLQEIHDLAMAQLADVGPSGLNLRAIAREMGMSSAGIYRYFESRDDLLVALIAAGFESLGEALRDATAGDGSPSARLIETFHCYRRWARAQPQTFALLFTDPVPNFVAPADGPTDQAVRRALSPLVALAAEVDGLPPVSGEVATANDFPDEFVFRMLQVWSSIHGFVSLEVFHHLDWAAVDLDSIFDDLVIRGVTGFD
jgi:AcrR family transcriptional regulator